ncbi:T9SS type A sorting domain-containing protein [Pontimicrobium sp. MEBiC01747]
MKKITLSIVLILPLLGFSQVVANGTFDTDTSNWVEQQSSTLSHSTDDASGSGTSGSMQIVAGAATNTGAKSNPNTQPAMAGSYLLKFKVKGTAGNKIQGSLFQGSVLPGSQYTIQTTGVWEDYSTTFTGITTANMNIRILGKTASATYLVDDVEFVELVTQDTWVANSNFEATSSWTATGTPTEATASFNTTTPQEGLQAGQLTFIANQTENQFLDNTMNDFGETVTPTEINTTFWVRSSNADLAVQVVFDLFDEAGTKITGANTGVYNITAADTWEEVTFTKPITNAFNQIKYRLKVRKQSPANSGDVILFDNITASFSYPTLSAPTFEENLTFKIYPNPVKDELKITNSGQISNIDIYNITGQKVLSNNKLINNILDVSSLNSGIYLLKLEDKKGQVTTKKLIVE